MKKNICNLAILATDLNGAIGKKGGLLRSHPRDFKLFRTLTTGVIVVMGSNTYHSLPKKDFFIKRETYGVVITREPVELQTQLAHGYVAMTEEEFLDREEFLTILQYQFGDFEFGNPEFKFENMETILIGGAYLYNQLEKYGVEELFLTTFLYNDRDGDVHVDLTQPAFDHRIMIETDNKEYVIEFCSRQPLEK